MHNMFHLTGRYMSAWCPVTGTRPVKVSLPSKRHCHYSWFRPLEHKLPLYIFYLKSSSHTSQVHPSNLDYNSTLTERTSSKTPHHDGSYPSRLNPRSPLPHGLSKIPPTNNLLDKSKHNLHHNLHHNLRPPPRRRPRPLPLPAPPDKKARRTKTRRRRPPP